MATKRITFGVTSIDVDLNKWAEDWELPNATAEERSAVRHHVIEFMQAKVDATLADWARWSTSITVVES